MRAAAPARAERGSQTPPGGTVGKHSGQRPLPSTTARRGRNGTSRGSSELGKQAGFVGRVSVSNGDEDAAKDILEDLPVAAPLKSAFSAK